MDLSVLCRRAAQWGGLSLAPHLLWEIVQLPLYELPENDTMRVAYNVLH